MIKYKYFVYSLELFLSVNQVVDVDVLGSSDDDWVNLGVVEPLVPGMVLLLN